MGSPPPPTTVIGAELLINPEYTRHDNEVHVVKRQHEETAFARIEKHKRAIEKLVAMFFKRGDIRKFDRECDTALRDAFVMIVSELELRRVMRFNTAQEYEPAPDNRPPPDSAQAALRTAETIDRANKDVLKTTRKCVIGDFFDVPGERDSVVIVERRKHRKRNLRKKQKEADAAKDATSAAKAASPHAPA